MPIAVHKMLVQIIDTRCLLAGHSSKERNEARHKDVRSARRGHRSKITRHETNAKCFGDQLQENEAKQCGDIAGKTIIAY